MNIEFLDTFEKNTRISNFMKVLPVGTELFHADGQTDITKLIAAFRKPVNAPKNASSLKSDKGLPTLLNKFLTTAPLPSPYTHTHTHTHQRDLLE
jgi:hypothetical protein